MLASWRNTKSSSFNYTKPSGALKRMSIAVSFAIEENLHHASELQNREKAPNDGQRSAEEGMQQAEVELGVTGHIEDQ